MIEDARGAGSPTAVRNFDGFEMLRPLGSGGMGAVHLARDAALDRLVAIKFMAPALSDPASQQRLLREARVIARLQHPNIVAIYRTGEVKGHPYIAYEYVEGRPLSALPRPQPWLHVLRIGLGLSRGLAAAHRAGILHRDIKSANAMLATTGEVKLLDFGLAKFSAREGTEPDPQQDGTEPTALDLKLREADTKRDAAMSLGAGTTLPPREDPLAEEGSSERLTWKDHIVGTPLFLAPELWLGAQATRRSDLYALGLVLYELLAGELPHAQLGTPLIARLVTTQDFPLLSRRFTELPRDFVELIDRLVSRDPRRRPESADAVRDTLEALTSIYLPFGESKADTVNADGARVSASFLRVSTHGHTLAALFYERMFALDPTVRQLFGIELTAQQRMLTAALKLIIDNLQRPERMVPFLLDLGRRHAGYGVQPSHLAVMGRALLETLPQLDEEWDDATARSWSQAYWHIAHVIQRGMESADPNAAGPRALPRAPWDLPLVTPQTQWAAVDDGDVAYQIVGRGSLELLVLSDFVSNLEHVWQHPVVARFFRQLASFARVVLLDRRGCGLSSRGGPISLDHGLADIRAVLDAAGLERPVLLGIGDGCTTATLFAALRPERTRALILFGSGRRHLEGQDRSGSAPDEILARQLQTLRTQWGTPLFVEALAPSLSSDAGYRAWWASSLRQGASPVEAAALWRLGAVTHARAIAHGLRVPTLVLHRAGDRFRPVEDSRDLAARIPGAHYIELLGADHTPWAGDADSVIAEIHRFVDGLVMPPPSERIVGCILAVRTGPPAPDAPPAPAAPQQFAADLIARHQGLSVPADHAEPDRTEHFVLGFFDGPGRALACAAELLDTSRRAGSSVSAALDIGLLSAQTAAEGEAVQRALSLAREAAPGEVLASDAIRDLAGGTVFFFGEPRQLLTESGLVTAHEVGWPQDAAP